VCRAVPAIGSTPRSSWPSPTPGAGRPRSCPTPRACSPACSRSGPATGCCSCAGGHRQWRVPTGPIAGRWITALSTCRRTTGSLGPWDLAATGRRGPG